MGKILDTLMGKEPPYRTLSSDEKAMQSGSGNFHEKLDERASNRSGTQMNIGPNMGREDVQSKKMIKGDSSQLGMPKSEISQSIDSYKSGADRAKAEASDMAPKYKKGGEVDHVRKHAAGHTFHDDYIAQFGKR